MLREDEVKCSIKKFNELYEEVTDMLGFMEGSFVSGIVTGLKIVLMELDEDKIIAKYKDSVNKRLEYIEEYHEDEDEHDLETTKKCIRCGSLMLCNIDDDKPVCDKCV